MASDLVSVPSNVTKFHIEMLIWRIPKLVAARHTIVLKMERVVQNHSYPLSLPTYFGVVSQSNYFVLVQLPRKRYTIHDFRIKKVAETFKSRRGSEIC